jgi:hypothetical protein
MQITIADDNENWHKWGALVLDWVEGRMPRPRTTSELSDMIALRGIVGHVNGPVRPVVFFERSVDGPVDIVLPSSQELQAALGATSAGPFPLPGFYDVAYGGALRAFLSSDEAEAFAIRRAGESAIDGISMVTHPDYKPPKRG